MESKTLFSSQSTSKTISWFILSCHTPNCPLALKTPESRQADEVALKNFLILAFYTLESCAFGCNSYIIFLYISQNTNERFYCSLSFMLVTCSSQSDLITTDSLAQHCNVLCKSVFAENTACLVLKIYITEVTSPAKTCTGLQAGWYPAPQHSLPALQHTCPF